MSIVGMMGRSWPGVAAESYRRGHSGALDMLVRQAQGALEKRVIPMLRSASFSIKVVAALLNPASAALPTSVQPGSTMIEKNLLLREGGWQVAKIRSTRGLQAM